MKILQKVEELLEYNPVTGDFTFLPVVRTRGRVTSKAGKAPSTINGYGYYSISIEGKNYTLHRLAWLLTYGELPILDIDHIDGNKLNNSISNLRLATRSENMLNTGKRLDNTTGYKGVSFCKQTGKYRATARLNGKCYSLGRFDTPDEAASIYSYFAKQSHGNFIHHSIDM
jgi:hypothetical protein